MHIHRKKSEQSRSAETRIHIHVQNKGCDRISSVSSLQRLRQPNRRYMASATKNKSHNLQQSLWQCSGEMDNFRILMYNLPAEVHEDRTEVQASIRLGALPFHFRETNAAMYKQDQFLPFTTAESSSFYKLRSAEGASLCNYVASLM